MKPTGASGTDLIAAIEALSERLDRVLAQQPVPREMVPPEPSEAEAMPVPVPVPVTRPWWQRLVGM